MKMMENIKSPHKKTAKFYCFHKILLDSYFRSSITMISAWTPEAQVTTVRSQALWNVSRPSRLLSFTQRKTNCVSGDGRQFVAIIVIRTPISRKKATSILKERTLPPQIYLDPTFPTPGLSILMFNSQTVHFNFINNL